MELKSSQTYIRSDIFFKSYSKPIKNTKIVFLKNAILTMRNYILAFYGKILILWGRICLNKWL